MDPISILSVIGTCADLCLGAGKLAVGLKSVAAQYKEAQVALQSLAMQCKLFAAEAGSIQRWMEDGPEQDKLDEAVWQQLNQTLEMADLVMSHCDRELQPLLLIGMVKSSKNKVTIVWNIDNLNTHESLLQSQCISLTLLLQVINLPSKHQQHDAMMKHQRDFKDTTSSLDGILSDGNSIHSRNSSILESRTSQSDLRTSFDELLSKSKAHQSSIANDISKPSEANESHTRVTENGTTLVTGSIASPIVPNLPANDPVRPGPSSHAFERWEQLSSHWARLTAFWISQLEQHAMPSQQVEPTTAQINRQIKDLSAAGANLFHAVVELHRLRIASERRYWRWHSQTMNEQSQMQEKIQGLTKRLNVERETSTSLSRVLQQRLIESTDHADHEDLLQRFKDLNTENDSISTLVQKAFQDLQRARQDLRVTKNENEKLQSQMEELQYGIESVVTETLRLARTDQDVKAQDFKCLLRLVLALLGQFRNEHAGLKLQPLQDQNSQPYNTVTPE